MQCTDISRIAYILSACSNSVGCNLHFSVLAMFKYMYQSFPAPYV